MLPLKLPAALRNALRSSHCRNSPIPLSLRGPPQYSVNGAATMLRTACMPMQSDDEIEKNPQYYKHFRAILQPQVALPARRGRNSGLIRNSPLNSDERPIHFALVTATCCGPPLQRAGGDNPRGQLRPPVEGADRKAIRGRGSRGG